MNIIKYRTHYEIKDYELGYCKDLENDFSIWDEVYYRSKLYLHYEPSNKTLYVPAGVPEKYLEDKCNCYVIKSSEYTDKKPMSFAITKPPRDDSQKESVRFLLGKNEYSHTNGQSQLVLSLPGGGGKTYCMTSAASFFNTKSIIIVHNNDIRDQWLDRILEYTNLTKDNVMTITSSTSIYNMINDKKKMKSLDDVCCFIVTHRLLGSYMEKYGFLSLNKLFLALGIGIKIIDEAHKEFLSTLMIDYATNVWKSFYLTATFIRSDYRENLIFQRSFNQIYKLVKNDEIIGRERNVNYIAHFVKSGISEVESMSMIVANKFNIHKYFDFEMEYMEIFNEINTWLKWYYIDKGFTGKTFILSSKKESCDLTNKIASELLPDKKCTVHYSGNKVDDLSCYDIISATDRMLGTGIDLGELNLIINLVPISSSGNIDQIIHRLMRGVNNEDAYYIEIIDKSVKQVMIMQKKREKVIRRLVKRSVPFVKDYKKK